MNVTAVTNLLARFTVIMGALMVIPLLISAYYRQGDTASFLLAMVITIAAGIVGWFFSREGGRIDRKECFAVVAFGWIVAALIASLPFFFSQTFATFSDSFFEAMSGLTTTGATLLEDIEGQTKGILFWRSFLQWLGGMGIIVLFLSVLPNLGIGGARLLKAEVPGVSPERLQPKTQQTAKALWGIYVGLSLAEVILLYAGGMSLFDSFTHTFSTMATGGFSTRSESIGAWDSPYIHIVITIFMTLAGCNFALYFRALRGKPITIIRDTEFRVYAVLLAGATVFLTINLITAHNMSGGDAFLAGWFQATSIMTTTGYVTYDYEVWPGFARTLLFVLMFVGGCSGSTGGSIKVGRILIVYKQAYREVYRYLHPRAVKLTKISNVTIRPEVIGGALSFVSIYILLFIGVSLALASMGLDMVSASSAVAASLGNVGPGLGLVGPAETYGAIPVVGRWLLALCMMLGRLEIYTVLVLFLADCWRRY